MNAQTNSVIKIVMNAQTNSVIKILMERDGMSEDEAIEQVREAQDEVMNGADPEEILADNFGLEPDYIFDII